MELHIVADSQKNLPAIENSSVPSSAHMHQESGIIFQTPVKANEPSLVKRKIEAAELPEKYRSILEFFDRMTSSLRLLSLQKRSPTFQNICNQIQILTGRKFSYRDLAQINYFLPEAVQIDMILIHDVKTMSMKPDMKIKFLFDVVEGHDDQSNYLALHKAFVSRLFNFFSKHPEGCKIPEAVLPEPFNQRSVTTTANLLPIDASTDSLLNPLEAELLNSSHLHPSFGKHFSRKDLVAETEGSQFLASLLPLSSPRYDCLTYQDTGSEQHRSSSNSCFESGMVTNQAHPQCSSSFENTPLKFALNAEKLMVETPAQSAPKRSLPSCDVKLKNMTSQNKTASTMSAKRTLNFSCSKGEDRILNSIADGAEQFKVVPSMIPQGETKGIILEDNNACLAAPLQKVEVSSCCTSIGKMVDLSGLSSHQQMSGCIADLVPIISHIFLYANSPSITKEELVHKIIMNKFDVVYKSEVEEQLEVLEKMVPDWISKKLAPSGDLLYNIKKVSDVNTVLERLISKLVTKLIKVSDLDH